MSECAARGVQTTGEASKSRPSDRASALLTRTYSLALLGTRQTFVLAALASVLLCWLIGGLAAACCRGRVDARGIESRGSTSWARAGRARGRTRTSGQSPARVLSNRQIGVAIGILVSQRRIDADAAFGLLVQASQRSQSKLSDVAERVIYTGTLDTLPVRDPRRRATDHECADQAPAGREASLAWDQVAQLHPARRLLGGFGLVR